MAKAKNATMTGTLVFRAKDTLVSESGKLVLQDENRIVVDVKRPRSSKYDRKVFPTSQLLQIVSSDEDVTVSYRGEYTEEWYVVSAEVTEGGFIVAQTEDGQQLICAPGNWDFVEEVTEEEEEKPAKSAKKAPAKAAKKPAKVEEEEEEEDDEEEDEDEEEKPAKSKSKAKKEASKPAKGKGKKAADEDEDDDEEDDDSDEWEE